MISKCIFSIFIDIRDIRELWNEGGIEKAIHIPRGMLEFWLDPVSPYYKKEKKSFDKNLSDLKSTKLPGIDT